MIHERVMHLLELPIVERFGEVETKDLGADIRRQLAYLYAPVIHRWPLSYCSQPMIATPVALLRTWKGERAELTLPTGLRSKWPGRIGVPYRDAQIGVPMRHNQYAIADGNACRPDAHLCVVPHAEGATAIGDHGRGELGEQDVSESIGVGHQHRERHRMQPEPRSKRHQDRRKERDGRHAGQHADADDVGPDHHDQQDDPPGMTDRDRADEISEELAEPRAAHG